MLQIVNYAYRELSELNAIIAAYWTVPISNCMGFCDAKAVTRNWSKTERDLFGTESSSYLFSNLGLKQCTRIKNP